MATEKPTGSCDWAKLGTWCDEWMCGAVAIDHRHLPVCDWVDMTAIPAPSLANPAMEPEKEGGEPPYEAWMPMVEAIAAYKNELTARHQGWRGEKGVVGVPKDDGEPPTDDPFFPIIPHLEAAIWGTMPEEEGESHRRNIRTVYEQDFIEDDSGISLESLVLAMMPEEGGE